MKKKKLLLAITVALIISVLTAIGTLAYFRITKSADKDIGVSANADGRIEISSFNDLFTYSVNPNYNDPSQTSPDSARHTLYFTSDITLTANVFITSDCHIDLAGHTLNLGGHTLTVTHAYSGTTVLSGGTVTPYDTDGNAAGKIVFDTPSSLVTVDGVTFRDADGNETPDTFTKNIWNEPDAAAEKYTVYNALYTVASSLVTPYDQRPVRLTFDEVAEIETLTLAAVLMNRTCCTDADGDEYCTYTARDLDLPTGYLSTDTLITYTSDNAALTEGGNVTTPGTSTTASLTVTVSLGSYTVTDTVKVHIFNPDDTESVLAAAESLFASRISAHYSEAEALHVFNRGTHLPSSILGAVAEYHAYTDLDATNEIDDCFDSVSGEVINFEPTSELRLLRVILTSGTDTVTLDYPMLSGNSGIITTNASIAQNIAQGWYGGRILITPQLKNSGDEAIVIGYNPVNLFPHTDDLTERYGITEVRYELMNNSYDVYEIIGNILKVKAGKDPSAFVQGVILNCIFTFGTEGDEEIQMEIYYDAQQTGNNVNEFLPYYTFFNESLYGELAGATTHDFSVQFSYSDVGPYVCYDIRVYNAETGKYEIGIPEFMGIELYYNGAVQHSFDEYDGSVSMTDLLDAYLEANSLTPADISAYGDAVWHFALDSSSIPHTNTSIDLVYNYKMTSEATEWIRYPNGELEPTTSALYISGVLHNAEDDVPDARLYEWMYNTFNISGSTYTGTEFIVVDWLLQNIDINYKATDSTFPDAQDLNFKGMEFLTGVKYLNLTDHPALSTAEGAGAAATAISGMINLETLILSNNAFRDRDDAASTDNGTLSLFANLDKVKYLYVDGNDIFSFEWLSEMSALEKVYLYDNSDSADFTDLVKVFYGSTGLVNLQIFKDLTDVGIAVYNVRSDNNYILFEDVAGINDYIRLSSVEYQKKLPEGADIRTLYEGLSTDPTDYALATAYSGVTQLFNHNIVFGYEGYDPTASADENTAAAQTATYFTLTDNITVGNEIEVSVVIVFHIIRT